MLRPFCLEVGDKPSLLWKTRLLIWLLLQALSANVLTTTKEYYLKAPDSAYLENMLHFDKRT